MVWEIVFTKKAQKQINSLDNQDKQRIKKAILEKLMINANLHLELLSGDLGSFYKFRVGDYRLICTKEDNKLIVTVVEIGHRKEVYKS